MSRISATEWKTVVLGDVCLIEKSKHNGGPAPYVGLKYISNDTGEFLGSLDPVTMKSATFRFDTRHLLYGRIRPYLNKVLTPDFGGHCSSEIFPLRPNKELDRRYLYYWLTSDVIRKSIDATSTGARMPRANMNEVMRFEMPLPPLEEQRRIVAVLDEAFEGLDLAHANAEVNLQDTRKLFQSIVRTLLMKADWKKVSLGSLCNVARGGSPRPIKQFITDDADGVNWIKIGDAEIGGRYINETKEKIRKEGIARSRFVKPGAFLLSNSMSFGRPYILRTSGCVHDGWLVLEPDYNRVDQGFLYFALGAESTFKQFDRLAAGATVKNLNIGLARSVKIPLPPISQQLEIVPALDEVSENLARVRGHAEATLTDIEELRQSLLQRAFAGELT